MSNENVTVVKAKSCPKIIFFLNSDSSPRVLVKLDAMTKAIINDLS